MSGKLELLVVQPHLPFFSVLRELVLVHLSSSQFISVHLSLVQYIGNILISNIIKQWMVIYMNSILDM